MKTMLGSQLPDHLKAEALRTFTHRYTGDHTPRWVKVGHWKIAEDGSKVPYPLQFKDDADWLAHSMFQVTETGTLSRGKFACQSNPTWPNNPEITGSHCESR